MQRLCIRKFFLIGMLCFDVYGKKTQWAYFAILAELQSRESQQASLGWLQPFFFTVLKRVLLSSKGRWSVGKRREGERGEKEASRYFQSIVSTSCWSWVIGVGSCRLAMEQKWDRTSIFSEHQQRKGKISLPNTWDYQQSTSTGKYKTSCLNDAPLCFRFFPVLCAMCSRAASLVSCFGRAIVFLLNFSSSVARRGLSLVLQSIYERLWFCVCIRALIDVFTGFAVSWPEVEEIGRGWNCFWNVSYVTHGLPESSHIKARLMEWGNLYTISQYGHGQITLMLDCSSAGKDANQKQCRSF